ncbi:unnamed protein product [Cochlearia groenlandica]
MAIDSSSPSSPSPNFPAETNHSETRKSHVVYKTKEIKFFNLKKKRIILQNENGPCPLIALCNVLLLRKDMKLDRPLVEVSQERLLSLAAELLIDVDGKDEVYIENHRRKISHAISLLPSFANGVNVNIKFRRIDDFELTPELAIFGLLKIPLYHAWIVDPQDVETVSAIGSKSYNDLITGLVTLETQTVKARSDQSSEKCSAAVGFFSQGCLKARGDIEEEKALNRALKLSEKEMLGMDTTCGDSSSSGRDSLYSAYFMSEDDTVDSGSSSCTSTPRSILCQRFKCDDQFSSKESDSDVGNKINAGEEVSSTTPVTKNGNHEHVTLELPPMVYYVEKCICSDSNGLTPREGKSTLYLLCTETTYIFLTFLSKLCEFSGEVISEFLSNNASQLTFPGLFFLEQRLEEDELCVFFCNNHFYTMLKHDNALYTLVTDQGYMNERDLVWEKLNKVKGDSVFVTGDFKVVKCDSSSNTAETIFSSINSCSKEVDEIDPDLKMAMELQQKEWGSGH